MAAQRARSPSEAQLSGEVETLTLTRQKKKEPLGLGVESDAETGMCTVTQLREHGPAMVGGMKVGYELLKVGGKSVFEMEHDEILKALGKGLSVKVEVRKNAEEGSRSGVKTVSRAAGEPLGLGFVTEGSKHIVSQVKEGLPAWNSGIRKGDVILKLAGQETYKLTHDALLSTIGAAGTEFYVEIEEGSGQVLAIQGISSVESGTEPLGIGIVSDEDGIATISKCVEGGAGHRMGLREDDEVIEINGRPMMGQEHDYVLSMLKAGGHELMMTIKRPSDGRLHKLKNRSAFVSDLGITLEVTKKGLVQVKDLVEGGAAEESGLVIGDVLIDINGKTVLKKTLSVVIATLRSDLGPEVPMIVCSQPHECVIERDHEVTKHQPKKTSKRPKYTLDIEKRATEDGPEPLGMGFVTDERGLHTVSQVVAGGPAFRAGVRADDTLVGINGVKMKGRDHDHVLGSLKVQEGEFQMTISRSSADPPPQRWTGVSVDDAEAAPAVILQTDDFDEVAF